MSDDKDFSGRGLSVDQVKAAIGATGFVFEAQVARILKSGGWEALIGDQYQDTESKDSREIDVVASKKSPRLSVQLIIECKKCEAGIVLFGERRALSLAEFDQDIVCKGTPNRFRSQPPIQYLRIQDTLTALKGGLVAQQIARLASSKPGHVKCGDSELRGMIYPLIKAAAHFARNAVTDTSLPSWHLSLPVLVVKGPIYWADEQENVEQVPYATLMTQVGIDQSSTRIPVLVFSELNLGELLTSLDELIANVNQLAFTNERALTSEAAEEQRSMFSAGDPDFDDDDVFHGN